MKPSVLFFAVYVAVAGCGNATEQGLPPFSGSITTRSFRTLDDRTFGTITVAHGLECDQMLTFGVDSRTTMVSRADGSTLPLDSLTVGRVVEVVYGFGAALSCPAQTGANRVTVFP